MGPYSVRHESLRNARYHGNLWYSLLSSTIFLPISLPQALEAKHLFFMFVICSFSDDQDVKP